jgi:hypothetical protein
MDGGRSLPVNAITFTWPVSINACTTGGETTPSGTSPAAMPFAAVPPLR